MTDTVYRGYDQAELDAQYNNRARFPNFTMHFAAWQDWSAAARASLPGALDLAFGAAPAQRLDLFPAAAPGAPLYVFIHGGYWYSLDKAHYSYVAQGLRPHGLATAVTNFGLAPQHDMDSVVQDNRAALAWLWRHAAAYGADPQRIYVAGHSAGGHLAALLLATDWPAVAPDLPPGLVKGACAIGGIFDLEPIRRSFLNATLRLTAAQVAAHSPLHQRAPAPAPLLLLVAADESDEFHRQSRDMAAAWTAQQQPAELVVPGGLDHFDVVNQLGDPGCALVTLQLQHIRRCFAPGGPPPG